MFRRYGCGSIGTFHGSRSSPGNGLNEIIARISGKSFADWKPAVPSTKRPNVRMFACNRRGCSRQFRNHVWSWHAKLPRSIKLLFLSEMRLTFIVGFVIQRILILTAKCDTGLTRVSFGRFPSLVLSRGYVASANHISKSVDGGDDDGGRAIEEANKQAKESRRETAEDGKRSVTTFPDPSSFGARLVYICVPRGCILADGDYMHAKADCWIYIVGEQRQIWTKKETKKRHRKTRKREWEIDDRKRGKDGWAEEKPL